MSTCDKHHEVELDTANQCWKCNQISGWDCPDPTPADKCKRRGGCGQGEYVDESELTPDEENEKHNKPCPYKPEIMCVQMPGDREMDGFYCDHGCPNRKTNIVIASLEHENKRDDLFGPFM